jgi:hypothetical protein
MENILKFEYVLISLERFLYPSGRIQERWYPAMSTRYKELCVELDDFSKIMMQVN